MRAHAFNMACRVDLMLLLPERTAEQEGQWVDFSVQGELMPVGSPTLTRPKLLSPTRDRFTTRTVVKNREGFDNAAEIFDRSTARALFGREVRGPRKQALALTSSNALSQDFAPLEINLAALEWVDVRADVPKLVGLSCDIERNPLSEPDTCDVVVRADELPIDLRILRGAQVDVWLYTHGNRDACRKGDAGHFSGIVRSIDKDRNANEVTLSCVDYTWALDQAKLTPAMLAVALDKPFDDVLRGILAEVPGASGWAVNLRGAEFGGDAKKAYGLKQRKRKEKRTHVSRGRRTGRFGLEFKTEDGQTTGGVRRRGFGLEFDVRTSVKTVIDQPTVGHALGSSDRTVWEAIRYLAALAGWVPNIGINPDGRVRLELLTANEAQTLTSPFARKMRDGDNITEMRESIDFGASVDIDRVEVRSANPDTGETYRGIAGRERGRWQHEGKLEVQVAHGLASSRECEARAAEIWRSYVNAEFSLEVVTSAPWSVGGGPDTPRTADGDGGPGYFSDLLFAEPGEPVQITFAGLEAAAKAVGVKRTPESVEQVHRQLLESRRVPEDAAKRIATAMREQSPTTLFQIRTITHSFDAVGDGDYTATLQLDAFLGRPDDQPKIVDSPLELEGAA